jgi:hypothetical protein
MTTTEYSEWLNDFSKEMARKKCEVQLLVDNAPCHKLVNLSNVQLEYLPPDRINILQAQDAGIIKSFKAWYQWQQVRKTGGCNNSASVGVLK